ncbi:MAG: hypothetical protein HFJ29_00280 [Clostridia bacterium]|nr:hypothetical protein [Clostridia bacterium]
MLEESRKTEDQLTKELEDVLRQLYEIFKGNEEERRKAVEAKARMALKIFKELKDEKQKETIELAKQGHSQVEIARQVGKNKATITKFLARRGILSVTQIKRMLRESMQQGEESISNEEWAAKTGVYPETIERIRQELENARRNEETKKQNPEDKKKRELSQTSLQILELARQGVPHGEIAEQYKRTAGYISSLARRNGIASVKVIRQELKQEDSKDLSSEGLATKLGVYPATIERIRKELEKTESKSKSDKEKEARERQKAQEFAMIIDLAKKGIKHTAIAKRCGKSTPTIDKIAKENGICTVREIVQMMRQPGLEDLSDEEWATKTGVYPETIAEIKERLEERQTTNETRPRTNNREIILSPEKEAKIIDLLKQGISNIQIHELVGLQSAWINNFAKKCGIANWRTIKQILMNEKGVTDEEVAERTGVYVETVARIRAEIEQAKKRREGAKTIYQQRAKAKKKDEELPTTPQKKLVKRIPPVITYQGQKVEGVSSQKGENLATKLGISSILVEKIQSELRKFPAVGAIAHENKVSKKVVEAILAEMRNQEYARTHTVVQYRTEMIKLRSAMKSANEGQVNATQRYRMDKLISEFSSFLTIEDYAFLAYGYAKERDYQRAIEIGEQHLGLETPSILGLQQKINEVIQKGLTEKGTTFKELEIG